MLAEEYPVKMVCAVLGVTRSSYYYQAVESLDEAQLRRAIKKTSAEWPTYGYRRITKQLQRGEWVVNHKRVQRLMCLLDIQAPIKRQKRRTTNSEHAFPRYPNLVLDLEIVRPEQVWVGDITYIRLHYRLV